MAEPQNNQDESATDSHGARVTDTRDTFERAILAQRRRRETELRYFGKRLGSLVLALAAAVLVAGIGYSLSEHTSVAYGLLWTLDAITTLGSFPVPANTSGRLILVALMVFGIGTLFYALATVAEFFVSGQLSGALELRRTRKLIDSYSQHQIVCGYGRVGRQVARDLRAAGADVVVIDHNPFNREAASADSIPYIEGHASDDDVLIRAGITRAAAIVACVDSDAENIFVTLSARELNSGVVIIARASAEDAEKKLMRAGADRVISPYKTTGSEMARIALHPQIEGIVNVADYRVEQIEVPAHCQGVGRTVGETRGRTVIVAVRTSSGRFEPQPSPQTVLTAGDTLVALGQPDALEELEAVFQPATVADR